jgi:hypothetical protein
VAARTTGVPIIGTADAANGLTFSYYKLEYGLGSSPGTWLTAGITLTGGGTSPVRGATLGTWDTSALTDGQVYTMRLTAYASNGATSVVSNAVVIDAKQVPGWPKYLPGANCDAFCSGSGATMADLDNNNQQEVIVPAAGNKIYAFHKDGTDVSGFPITVASGEYFTNPPVVADLDGDLKPEIIVNAVITSSSRHLYVFKGDGTPYPGWGSPVYSASSTSQDLTPTIGDIDNDGRPELVYILSQTAFVSTMYAVHADGTSLGGFPKPISVDTPWISMPATISDIDHDGQKDIMYATYNKLYVLNGSGVVRSGWPVTLPNNAGNAETIQGPPAIGDINGDGQSEVIVTGQQNGALGETFRVYAYNASGTQMAGWPVAANASGYVGLPLNVASTADIDNDGKDEVMVGQSGSSIIDDGTGRRSTSVFMGQGQLSMADFVGDGNIKFPGSYNPGLQWGNSDFSVYWNNNNFSTLATEHASANPFAVSDLDRNGQQEFAATIIHQGEEYIYLYEMPGSTHPKDSWPMFTHDAARTSHYTVGQVDTDTTPPQVVLVNPISGANVSGSVQLQANATDDQGVARVEFRDNGSLLATDTTFPYAWAWDVSAVTPGSHSLTAVAYDAAGNPATSAAVAANVLDTTPPPTPAPAPPPPAVKRGDANSDNKVNLLDLSLVLSHYGRAGSVGDLNGDGRDDLFDLSIVLHEYGK